MYICIIVFRRRQHIECRVVNMFSIAKHRGQHEITHVERPFSPMTEFPSIPKKIQITPES